MRRIQCAGALAVMLLVAACAGEKKDGTGGVTRDSATVAAPVAASSENKRAVLFLGTSLTAGLGLEPDSAYPQQLQRKVDSASLPYRTINAGVSGETSAGLLRRLDWVLKQPAAVIIVETGANDGLRGQAVEGTKETIREVLARIHKEEPGARVVLAQMEAPPNLGREYTTAFHEMFPALAKEAGVTLMPFLLAGVAGHPDLNQGDGIHPNLKGEAMVVENVWKTLEGVLRQLPTPRS